MRPPPLGRQPTGILPCCRSKRLKVKEEELKLPPVVSLDACEVRERDWSNVVTAHEGDPTAYCWRLRDFAMSEHVLRPPRAFDDKTPDAPVTAVCVSACGNYGFVGNAAGRIDRYNLQSGLFRGSYNREGAGQERAVGIKPKVAPNARAHDGSIAGVSSDSFNRTVSLSWSSACVPV